ncbi:Golgin-84 [Apostasia shenzhenica]|uniref:Golgin-84 n=1 Tax=Apostasia shenzhenica TaxID=1088818 RepID=A0A2I0ANV2_9ASPA|nr:Golgin-84 [Apostasia shenzhenica]
MFETDLLEVVDRRAKLVVSELSDEQSDVQASASNGSKVKPRKTKSKEKVQGLSRKAIGGFRKSSEAELEQNDVQVKVDKLDDSINKNAPKVAVEISPNKVTDSSLEPPSDASKDSGILNAASLEVPENGKVESVTNEVPEGSSSDYAEILYSRTNDVSSVTNSENAQERASSPALKGEEHENVHSIDPLDTISNANASVKDTSLIIDEQKMELKTNQKQNISDGHQNEKTLSLELSPNTNGEPVHKAGSSSVKVQEQIDEAQGLLKTAVSTGQSKEARLARVCAGLSSRLQEYKSENAQLEELLTAERELCSSYEARIKQLQQDLSAAKTEGTRAELNMSEVLIAKNSEIESLAGTVDSLKKQVTTLEGKLSSLQENLEAVMRSRELAESRMIQALREELAVAERRAEEERTAHNATKMAAVEREVELEHRAVEASNALARIQRKADESTSSAAELEHKVALLEVECASLTQELQELEARNRRGQKKASEETTQTLQMQAWQEEVERARQGQKDAENKLSSMEAELQKMRVEMAGMKRDAEHYSRQEHMELEKRYRDLTDLLYHKQTQLEAMASEKAAAEFQLEKELKRLQEAQFEAERNKALRRSSALWEEDTDIKVLEPLPLHHRHMAAASIQLQRAAKLLDSGAVRATRFLWRYPVARMSLLFYLVFVHFFLMYLLHHLQV